MAVRTRIVAAYGALDENTRLPLNENPVEKVLLVVSETDGEVNFDEVPDDIPAVAGGQADAVWRNAMYAKVTSVQRNMIDMQNTMVNHHAATDHRLSNLEANVGRIALQPVVRRQDGGRGGGNRQAAGAATLGACPRDLHALWHEYEFGTGGRKPARQFTAIERGRNKFKYSRRKIIWNAIDRMVRSGNTAQVAIDKIYEEYGRLPVMRLIKEMRQDERNGGRATLQ